MIGKLSENILEAVLETLPFELSVIGENDKFEQILRKMKEGVRDKTQF